MKNDTLRRMGGYAGKPRAPQSSGRNSKDDKETLKIIEKEEQTKVGWDKGPVIIRTNRTLKRR
jgi:hypothetical protein